MIEHIVRRIVYLVPLLLMISFISFTIITLPPGDYLTAWQANLTQQGGISERDAVELAQRLREHYGLDDPFLIQYGRWLFGILRGDFGFSFIFQRPVSEIIWERLQWTFVITISAWIFSVIFGLLPGIYSATHQYGFLDNVFTVLAFLGLSIPNFFLALLLIYFLAFVVGVESVTGLFSPEMIARPWSWAKLVDFLRHVWVPIVILGTAGTAHNMRVMRGNLLDILHQPYIQTARAKGLKERVVVYKHALRNAIHPIIMGFGMFLPWLIEGAFIISVVLNLPTTGSAFLKSIQQQDMYLAGSFLLLVGILVVLGNLLADIALAWVDPRVRYE